MVGPVEVLQELPELAVDARHRRGGDADNGARRQRRHRLAPRDLHADHAQRVHHVAGLAVGHADLQALQAVELVGLDLGVDVLRRPRHGVEDRLVVLGRDLDELGHRVLLQHLELVGIADQEGHALDAEQRRLADLLDVEDVGHLHQPVAHGVQMLGPLVAQRPAGMDGDLHLAVGHLADLLGEQLAVLGVEVAVRPDGRQVELHARLRLHDGGRAQHRDPRSHTGLKRRPASKLHRSPHGWLITLPRSLSPTTRPLSAACRRKSSRLSPARSARRPGRWRPARDRARPACRCRRRPASSPPAGRPAG